MVLLLQICPWGAARQLTASARLGEPWGLLLAPRLLHRRGGKTAGSPIPRWALP